MSLAVWLTSKIKCLAHQRAARLRRQRTRHKSHLVLLIDCIGVCSSGRAARQLISVLLERRFCRSDMATRDLARNARVDRGAIEEHLSGICRQLIAVPHDRGVADGDLVILDVLKPETRRAYKEIAAAIVDGYK